MRSGLKLGSYLGVCGSLQRSVSAGLVGVVAESADDMM